MRHQLNQMTHIVLSDIAPSQLNGMMPDLHCNCDDQVSAHLADIHSNQYIAYEQDAQALPGDPL